MRAREAFPPAAGRLCRPRRLVSAVLDASRDKLAHGKGSLGSKMGPIVKALERQFKTGRAEQAPVQT